MTSNHVFAAALGIAAPWFVRTVDFDAGQRRLTIHVDFAPGSRFTHPKAPGEHPVHDTQVKRLRHLNFFQHECHLEVRVPLLRLPDGKVALFEPDWVGKLAGFTLLFEALVLMLAQQMPFAAVARIVGESWHRVHAICRRYVDLALARADLSALTSVAIDETSYRRGHSYLTLAADADARKVVFVAKGRDALNDAPARQIGRKVAPRRQASREAPHLDARRRLGLRLVLCGRRGQFFELQFQLIDQPLAPLGARA